MKTKMISLFVLFVVFGCAQIVNAQDSIQTIAQKIEAKDYTINVANAMPSKGGSIYLASGYDLQIKSDSVISYLPYFGEMYSAPMDMNDGGIKISVPMENYKCKLNKKGDGWEISFNARKSTENLKFILSIYNNGNAWLSVTSSSRTEISFNGQMK